MTAGRAHAALANLREEAAACRRLWVAVLTRILLDADRSDRDGAAARAWLRDSDRLALEFAGLDVEPATEALGQRHGGVSSLHAPAVVHRSDPQIPTDAN